MWAASVHRIVSVAHSCVSRMPSLSKVLALPRMIVAGPIAWCLLGFLRFTALPSAGSVITMTGFAPYHTCDPTNESLTLQVTIALQAFLFPTQLALQHAKSYDAYDVIGSRLQAYDMVKGAAVISMHQHLTGSRR